MLVHSYFFSIYYLFPIIMKKQGFLNFAANNKRNSPSKLAPNTRENEQLVAQIYL
jgi:hypothetical protein